MIGPGSPLEIKIYGTPDLIAKFDKLAYMPKSPRLRAIFEDAGNAYVVLAQMSVPKQTRLLKASIHHKVRGFGGTDPEVRIGAGSAAARYAYYVEVGTKPQIRHARNRRFMHWFMEGAKTIQVPVGLKGMRAYTATMYGELTHNAFAKTVKHPGTKPQPYFYKHFPHIAGRFIQAITKLINDDISSVGGSEAAPTVPGPS